MSGLQSLDSVVSDAWFMEMSTWKQSLFVQKLCCRAIRWQKPQHLGCWNGDGVPIEAMKPWCFGKVSIIHPIFFHIRYLSLRSCRNSSLSNWFPAKLRQHLDPVARARHRGQLPFLRLRCFPWSDTLRSESGIPVTWRNSQRTPFSKLVELLDTQVFSGSVKRRSCWRFLRQYLWHFFFWKTRGNTQNNSDFKWWFTSELLMPKDLTIFLLLLLWKQNSHSQWWRHELRSFVCAASIVVVWTLFLSAEVLLCWGFLFEEWPVYLDAVCCMWSLEVFRLYRNRNQRLNEFSPVPLKSYRKIGTPNGVFRLFWDKNMMMSTSSFLNYRCNLSNVQVFLLFDSTAEVCKSRYPEVGINQSFAGRTKLDGSPKFFDFLKTNLVLDSKR